MKRLDYSFNFAMTDDDNKNGAYARFDGRGDEEISGFQAQTQDAAEDATKYLLGLFLSLAEKLRNGEIKCKVVE